MKKVAVAYLSLCVEVFDIASYIAREGIYFVKGKKIRKKFYNGELVKVMMKDDSNGLLGHLIFGSQDLISLNPRFYLRLHDGFKVTIKSDFVIKKVSDREEFLYNIFGTFALRG